MCNLLSDTSSIYTQSKYRNEVSGINEAESYPLGLGWWCVAVTGH